MSKSLTKKALAFVEEGLEYPNKKKCAVDVKGN